MFNRFFLLATLEIQRWILLENQCSKQIFHASCYSLNSNELCLKIKVLRGEQEEIYSYFCLVHNREVRSYIATPN